MAKITYNKQTTELEPGYQATMKCKNKKMLSDVVFVAEAPIAQIEVDTVLDGSSENAISNKAVYDALNALKDSFDGRIDPVDDVLGDHEQRIGALEGTSSSINDLKAKIDALQAQLNSLTIKLNDVDFTKDDMTYSLTQKTARDALGIIVPDTIEGGDVTLVTKEYVDNLINSRDYGDLG